MSWGKKNGGVISVYYSILFGISALVISASLYRAVIKKDITLQSETRQTRHLIYLEMIYYIRNEIYDGYYSGLSYESNGWKVRITFNKKEQMASMMMSHEDFVMAHRFLYDKECRCILDILEGAELVEDDEESEENMSDPFDEIRDGDGNTANADDESEHIR